MIVGHIGGSSSGGSSGSSSGLDIEKSLRFRTSANTYLSRTFGSSSNRKTLTISAWVKRGTLGTTSSCLFESYSASSDTGRVLINFNASDQLSISAQSVVWKTTTAVFRDTSSWYHLVVAFDTTQTSSSERIRIYVNGVRITAFAASAVLDQDTSLGINHAARHVIGSSGQSPGVYAFDGYFAEFYFIDGQALDPSYFGEFSTETDQWIPKKYTGTYGANGFYLDFKDGSSLTNLTADKSGNGNNWTATNISLTPGTTYDWVDDTPTNNFAVGNPMQRQVGTASLAAGNLEVSITNYGTAVASIGVASGKWYWEVTPLIGSSGFEVGICKDDFVGQYNDTGSLNNGYIYLGSNGNKTNSNVGVAYGAAYTTNDVIGVAYDASAGSLTFYKNGISQGVAFTGLTGVFFPAVGNGNSGSTKSFSLNFGQRPFNYTPPTGFKTLCAKNAPAPVIKNPALHFDLTLDVGNGSTKSISGVKFAPGLVWRKGRGVATYNNHTLYDTVRGTTKMLQSNQSGVEVTVANSLTAFNADGFSLGSYEDSNTNNNPYVSWLWKAGGAPVTNTDGSITSQVSANTMAGFSIVTYSGTGANATVGHGLGVAPKMVIAKRRSAVSDWCVYAEAIGANSRLLLSQTNASAADATMWNSTAPTSTVFNIGTNVGTNSANTYVAYCFAEVPGFSRIGSYTGNGSADGPFVFCGFKPAFVMVKRSDAASDWAIIDNGRNALNPVGLELDANLSQAEVSTGWSYDFVANGFKYRSATGLNVSGATYVYAAFAEAPFNYANAR